MPAAFSQWTARVTGARPRALVLAAGVAGSLAACQDAAAPDRAALEPSAQSAVATRRLVDDVVGVAVDIPSAWRVEADPVLFNTYGFTLFDPAGPQANSHERSPVARIARAYETTPAKVEGLVEDLMRKYEEFPLERTTVEVGGRQGIAVSGLPGTDPYSLVYVVDGDRVYRIGLWSQAPGLDARARDLLRGLRFTAPKRSIASLDLVPVAVASRQLPSPAEMAVNRQMQAERVRMVAEQGGEPAAGETEPAPRFARGLTSPGAGPAAAAVSAAQVCEEGQPSWLLWQTVWDYTNRFYSGYTTTFSGTYYNMRPNDPGWSAMSGNYGSWWGQPNTYHVYKCEPYVLNQHYANDWPAHKNANVYSAITGVVEWAGWDYYDAEGYKTLGNYVVVRNGGYRAIMAHLTSIAVSKGQSVGMNTVIGYAGKTGGGWDEHVHSRVAYGESLTYNGQPYGGHTVWPVNLRCVSCRATDPGDIYGNGDGQFDYKDANGAKFYRRFYKNRWMRG